MFDIQQNRRLSTRKKKQQSTEIYRRWAWYKKQSFIFEFVKPECGIGGDIVESTRALIFSHIVNSLHLSCQAAILYFLIITFLVFFKRPTKPTPTIKVYIYIFWAQRVFCLTAFALGISGQRFLGSSECSTGEIAVFRLGGQTLVTVSTRRWS